MNFPIYYEVLTDISIYMQTKNVRLVFKDTCSTLASASLRITSASDLWQSFLLRKFLAATPLANDGFGNGDDSFVYYQRSFKLCSASNAQSGCGLG